MSLSPKSPGGFSAHKIEGPSSEKGSSEKLNLREMNSSLSSAENSHLAHWTTQRFLKNRVISSAGARCSVAISLPKWPAQSSQFSHLPLSSEASFLICQHGKLLAGIFFQARDRENKEVGMLQGFGECVQLGWENSPQSKAVPSLVNQATHVKDHRQHPMFRMFLCKNEYEPWF